MSPRILVAGAGIAGATLAALLRQRGQPVTLVERGHADDDAGYMLGLMPLGGRVLNGLGLAEAYPPPPHPHPRHPHPSHPPPPFTPLPHPPPP